MFSCLTTHYTHRLIFNTELTGFMTTLFVSYHKLKKTSIFYSIDQTLRHIPVFVRVFRVRECVCVCVRMRVGVDVSACFK